MYFIFIFHFSSSSLSHTLLRWANSERARLCETFYTVKNKNNFTHLITHHMKKKLTLVTRSTAISCFSDVLPFQQKDKTYSRCTQHSTAQTFNFCVPASSFTCMYHTVRSSDLVYGANWQHWTATHLVYGANWQHWTATHLVYGANWQHWTATNWQHWTATHTHLDLFWYGLQTASSAWTQRPSPPYTSELSSSCRAASHRTLWLRKCWLGYSQHPFDTWNLKMQMKDATPERSTPWHNLIASFNCLSYHHTQTLWWEGKNIMVLN
jgi:hypothetical protein